MQLCNSGNSVIGQLVEIMEIAIVQIKVQNTPHESSVLKLAGEKDPEQHERWSRECRMRELNKKTNTDINTIVL